MTPTRVDVNGPSFEDFRVGQVFDDAPSVTITSGFAALHEAFFGERRRLPLDAELCRAITGHDALASPGLVCNLAAGQRLGLDLSEPGNRWRATRELAGVRVAEAPLPARRGRALRGAGWPTRPSGRCARLCL